MEVAVNVTVPMGGLRGVANGGERMVVGVGRRNLRNLPLRKNVKKGGG